MRAAAWPWRVERIPPGTPIDLTPLPSVPDPARLSPLALRRQQAAAALLEVSVARLAARVVARVAVRPAGVEKCPGRAKGGRIGGATQASRVYSCPWCGRLMKGNGARASHRRKCGGGTGS